MTCRLRMSPRARRQSHLAEDLRNRVRSAKATNQALPSYKTRRLAQPITGAPAQGQLEGHTSSARDAEAGIAMSGRLAITISLQARC
jgi:hypothetical protein